MNVYTKTQIGGGGGVSLSSLRTATLLSVVALTLLFSCPAGDGTSSPLVPSTPIAEEIKDKDPAILYKVDMHEDAQSLFSRGDINNPYLFTFGVTSVHLMEEIRGEMTIIGDTNNDGKEEELYNKNVPLQSFFVSDVPSKNSAMLKKRMYVVDNDVLVSTRKDTAVNAIISPAYKENDYIVGIGLTGHDLISYDELPEDIAIRVRILYEEETGDAVKGTVVLKDAKVEVSKADRYKIYTWRDLQHMNYDLRGDYVVENDIIFPDVGHYGYKNFVPIGPIGIRPELAEGETPDWECKYNFQHAFKGTFDGNDHEIRGLYMNYPHNSALGLFGHTDGATIKNITIYHRGIYGADSVGGLAGYLVDSTVRNAHVYAEDGEEIVGKVAFVGGLVGGSADDPGRRGGSSIFDSSAHTTVRVLKAKVTTGQLISSLAGGLAGSVRNGMVSNSYATGDVYGTKKIGGLVGIYSSSSASSKHILSRVYATGNVIGQENIGGLAGQVWGMTSVEGYATGNVRGTDVKSVKNAGGLIGEVQGTSSINGYSTGQVKGCINVGGLIGATAWRWEGATSVRGYSVGDVSGCNGVGGLIGSIGVYDHYGEKRAGTNAHAIVGYARGDVSGDGRDTRIGLLIGNIFDQKRGDFDGYTSTKTRDVANTNGLRGIKVDISQVNNNNYRGIFQKLTFGDKAGQWTWVGDGKWPAVNIGDVAPAEEQPIE